MRKRGEVAAEQAVRMNGGGESPTRSGIDVDRKSMGGERGMDACVAVCVGACHGWVGGRVCGWRGCGALDHSAPSTPGE
jgi:hypothetical protein